MIHTLMRVAWAKLWRDRAALMLVFVVPMVFFSIFALIFGQQGGGGAQRVDVLVVDESLTPASRRLAAALAADPALRVHTTWRAAGSRDTARFVLDRARAEQLVREGECSVAMVLPAGIDTSLMRFDGRGEAVLLLTDPADPIAPRMATGLLQRAALGTVRAAAAEFGATSGAVPPEELMPVRTRTRPVTGGERRPNGFVSFYAAGIAVMFLMFSASGAGGALIEEEETGTLERVLSSRVGMTRLLFAKWLHIVRLGVLQIAAMFAWGAIAFRLPLLDHLAGFAVVTVFTAACCASFGLVIATLSRSRQQLQAIANLVVLSMSGIGGSMFPRPLMGETMRKVSLVGFNSWALDGYLKVFWRDLPVTALWPQLLALAGFAAVYFALARRLAARWETA
jgi:ABC-2 type transport system permease protein